MKTFYCQLEVNNKFGEIYLRNLNFSVNHKFSIIDTQLNIKNSSLLEFKIIIYQDFIQEAILQNYDFKLNNA